MGTRKKAKAKVTCALSSNRLSSLPLEMKGKILSNLNVEEAVRAGALSSSWRNAWTNMPDIFLCDGNFSKTKFITLANMVLSLHRGPIEKFDISGNKSYHDAFARWMLMLSKKSPSSIKIELTSGPGYSIPECLFFINDLKYLHLENCIINLPPAFQGFKSLRYLNLNGFSSTDSDIQNLICYCAMVTNLRLTSFEGINCLNIEAPKLEYLVVEGTFEDIHLDAPNLEKAYISLNNVVAYQSSPVAHDRKSYLNQSLGSLSDITTLHISGYFLTFLSKGRILTKLPAPLDRLETIYLTMSFWDPREVLTAYSLFQNAPNLKRLEIWNHTQDEDYLAMTTWDQLTLQMDHLVTVTMDEFTGLGYEVDFVGKLLSSAPALEEVKIEEMSEIDGNMALKKLLALPRVSPKARVIVTT